MKYFVSGVAMLLAASAWAHDPLPSANWCQYGQTSTVASFTFTGANITAWVSCVEAGNCPDPRPVNAGTCDSVKSCGNFDDDYGKTALMINAHCSQYADASLAGRGAPPLPGREAGSVAPVVYGPQIFLATDHHAHYQKNTGIHGVCAKCTLAPVQNIPGN